MFAADDFEKLYASLSGDMVDVDCGIRCGKFCCDPENTTKYLLPGEQGFLEANGAGSALAFVDNLYFSSYRAQEGSPGIAAGCACTQMRGHRPFCCRVFPFRPRIEQGVVVGVKKARGDYLQPCWIEEPLSAWAEAARAAWTFVLSDLDNLRFYAQLSLLWEMSRSEDPADAPQALARIASLSSWARPELLGEATRFFDRT